MDTFNYYNNLTIENILENWLQVADFSDFVTNNNLYCNGENDNLYLVYTDKLISVSEEIPSIYAIDESLDIWENTEILRKMHKLVILEYINYIKDFID